VSTGCNLCTKLYKQVNALQNHSWVLGDKAHGCSPSHHVLLHAPEVGPGLCSTTLTYTAAATAAVTASLLLTAASSAVAAAAAAKGVIAILLLLLLEVSLAYVVQPVFWIPPAHSTAQDGTNVNS
jgi:hypothetical protein